MGEEGEEHFADDNVKCYGYEGVGSAAGSVGSCKDFGEEENLDFLNTLGPRFKTLAAVCKKTWAKGLYTRVHGFTTDCRGQRPRIRNETVQVMLVCIWRFFFPTCWSFALKTLHFLSVVYHLHNTLLCVDLEFASKVLVLLLKVFMVES